MEPGAITIEPESLALTLEQQGRFHGLWSLRSPGLSRADRQAAIRELHKSVRSAPIDRLAELPLHDWRREPWKVQAGGAVSLSCPFCASDSFTGECYAGGHFGTDCDCADCGATLSFQNAPARPADRP